MLSVLCVCLLLVPAIHCSSNGLERVPAMGWNSWNWVSDRVDCKADPYRCLDERVMKQMAQALQTSGLQKKGYVYINLSEGWPSRHRAPNGSLIANPTNFPNGIKPLADWMHNNGFKFGIYLDAGTKTCAGFPGSLGHEKEDVATVASWGVDYVWLDGCNLDKAEMPAKYELWGKLFNECGRDIIWEVSWPAYVVGHVNYYLAASVGHEFRYYRDIRPNWDIIMDIVNATVKLDMEKYTRPGSWPLPDMMEVGNPPLTAAENRAHFSLWAILASPLHAGNDVRNMTKDTVEILGNTEVIAIDQDPLGKMGVRTYTHDQQSVWSKELADGSRAVLLLNAGATAKVEICASLENVGLNPYEITVVRDLWQHKNVANVTQKYCAEVGPHDVAMLHLWQ